MGSTVVESTRERVVDRLRLSVTDRCDLRCGYCMPRTGVCKMDRGTLLTIEEMAAAASILVKEFSIRSIRLTGGEPLIRSGLDRLVVLLNELDIEDLALTTNAQRLAKVARYLHERGLARVNISLDTLDADLFRTMTGGGEIEKTLEGIDASLEAGLHPVKINVVVMRGINDGEVGRLAGFGLERGCEVRFLELMPIGVARPMHAERFVPADEILQDLSRRFKIDPEPERPGETSRMYTVEDDGGRRGRVGLVSPQTAPFCSHCGRLRLTTDGRLLGCLHEEKGVSLVKGLRASGGVDEKQLIRNIARVIAEKPRIRLRTRKTPMHVVGG